MNTGIALLTRVKMQNGTEFHFVHNARKGTRAARAFNVETDKMHARFWNVVSETETQAVQRFLNEGQRVW